MNSDLNECEVRSILVSAVTIYCGLFFLTNDLDTDTSLSFSFLIIIVNSYFLVYWCRKMFGAMMMQMVQKIRCCRKRWGYNNKVKDGFSVDLLTNKNVANHFKLTGGMKKEHYTIAPHDYKTPESKFTGELPATNMLDLYLKTMRFKQQDTMIDYVSENPSKYDLEQTAEESVILRNNSFEIDEEIHQVDETGHSAIQTVNHSLETDPDVSIGRDVGIARHNTITRLGTRHDTVTRLDTQQSFTGNQRPFTSAGLQGNQQPLNSEDEDLPYRRPSFHTDSQCSDDE